MQQPTERKGKTRKRETNAERRRLKKYRSQIDATRVGVAMPCVSNIRARVLARLLPIMNCQENSTLHIVPRLCSLLWARLVYWHTGTIKSDHLSRSRMVMNVEELVCVKPPSRKLFVDVMANTNTLHDIRSHGCLPSLERSVLDLFIEFCNKGIGMTHTQGPVRTFQSPLGAMATTNRQSISLCPN